MKSYKIRIGASETYDTGGSFSFNDPIVHLRVGNFSGSEIKINARDDRTVKSAEMARSAWKTFVHEIEAVRALTFVKKADVTTRKWYAEHIGRRISYIDIRAYNAEHEFSYTSVQEESIQIHDVEIGYVLALPIGDQIGLSYKGHTKIWF